MVLRHFVSTCDGIQRSRGPRDGIIETLMKIQGSSPPVECLDQASRLRNRPKSLLEGAVSVATSMGIDPRIVRSSRTEAAEAPSVESLCSRRSKCSGDRRREELGLGPGCLQLIHACVKLVTLSAFVASLNPTSRWYADLSQSREVELECM